jgi:hypothetical protein
VTFKPFVFDPPAASVLPLWTFTYLGNTYSFDATSVTVPFKSVNLLAVEGVGMAHVAGRDDTAGIWNITANKAGVSFSFSSSAGTPEATIPDSGNTLLLLGLGLTGFALLRSRLAC